MNTTNHPTCLSWIWLSVVVLVLDQGSKFVATQGLVYGEPVSLLPFFDLTLLHNKGAAFSFLASQGGWQRWFFSAVALGMSLYLIVWLKKNASYNGAASLSSVTDIGWCRR